MIQKKTTPKSGFFIRKKKLVFFGLFTLRARKKCFTRYFFLTCSRINSSIYRISPILTTSLTFSVVPMPIHLRVITLHWVLEYILLQPQSQHLDHFSLHGVVNPKPKTMESIFASTIEFPLEMYLEFQHPFFCNRVFIDHDSTTRFFL